MKSDDQCMDRDYLERLVTHEEIKEAVWDCGSSKAPSPDGFSFAFKAFDYISWNYLDHILDSLGFRLKWRSWIKTCLSSSRASIIVNGSHTSEFSINRDLRQGDPLSPFLFILVMEGLHTAFADALGNGLISGININNSSINISHLFFADDVIITTGWNARDLENIIRVLHVFYLASGLKINI
ncbi:reverse transcriptase domain, reverse transcriptase zinc-binding domain protein [Tanacetum coccineum]